MLVLFRVKWCRDPLAFISKGVVEVTEIHTHGRTGLSTHVNHKYPSWIKTYLSELTFYCKKTPYWYRKRKQVESQNSCILKRCLVVTVRTEWRYAIFLNKSPVPCLRNRKLVSNPRKRKNHDRCYSRSRLCAGISIFNRGKKN